MLLISTQALKGLQPLLMNAGCSLCTVSRPVAAPVAEKSAGRYGFTVRTIHKLAEVITSVPCAVTASSVCMRGAASSRHGGFRQHSLLHMDHTTESEPPMSREDKLLLVQTEFQLYQTDNLPDIPSKISSDNLLYLSAINSSTERLAFLRYLYLNEMKSLKEKERGQSRRRFSKHHCKMIKKELEANPDHISYGLWRNSFFLKWDNRRMDSVYNHRLINSILYGQHLLFDYSFGNYMNLQERKALSKQICECINVNRRYFDPFYFHFCNFNPELKCERDVILSNPTLMDDRCLVDVHKDSYCELFPKERMVYITPDASEDMTKFDHNVLYIIGAFVDKSSQPPLTMAKAKKEGIRMQRLPLDRFGSKKLPLNQVLGILLEMKHSGNWEKAFDLHIPTRKLLKQEFGSVDHFERHLNQRRRFYATFRKGIYRDD